MGTTLTYIPHFKVEVSFHKLVLPTQQTPHTALMSNLSLACGASFVLVVSVVSAAGAGGPQRNRRALHVSRWPSAIGPRPHPGGRGRMRLKIRDETYHLCL